MTVSWAQKTVGEVLQLEYGKPLTDADRKPDGLYPVYGANGEKDRSDRFYCDTPTIVVGRKGSAGELTLTEARFWPLDVTYFVTFDRDLHELGFLYYLLKSLDLPRLAKGVKPGLNRSDVYELSTRVPKREQQRRIAGLLDKAFGGIASAAANADANLQSARAVYASFLQRAFDRASSDWAHESLGDLAVFRNGINFTKASKGEKVPIVGVKDFQDYFWAPLEGLATVTSDGPLPDADALREDDLLFVRSNGNVELIGRCLLVGKVTGKITHSGFTIRARLHDRRILPRYLCHFLKSNTARREMIDAGIGTNIKSLNQATLSTLAIPIPPQDVQVKLVAQLEDLSKETQRLARNFEKKLERLQALQASLLQQGLDGSL